MALRLNGSSSGYVELDVPAAAGSHTLTLPNSGGSSGQVLSTNGSGGLSFVDRMTAAGPAFRAGMTTSQTLSHNVSTKVIFDSVTFDTNSCYDNSTNYRFTPTLAGYYQVNFMLDLNAISGRTYYFSPMLYKNGSLYGRNEYSNTATSGQREGGNTVDIVYLNGSTDYIEAYAYCYDYTNTAAVDINASSKFSAVLVRES